MILALILIMHICVVNVVINPNSFQRILHTQRRSPKESQRHESDGDKFKKKMFQFSKWTSWGVGGCTKGWRKVQINWYGTMMFKDHELGTFLKQVVIFKNNMIKMLFIVLVVITLDPTFPPSKTNFYHQLCFAYSVNFPACTLFYWL